MARLFVYGTLLEGEVNHPRLGGATLLGSARTRAEHSLRDLGAYPALVSDGSDAVDGELYEVDDDTLAALDVFEGHPHLFERITIALDDGTSAECYRMTAARAGSAPRIASGTWRGRPR